MKPSTPIKGHQPRKARLGLETLEERLNLSWYGIPPGVITPPTNATTVRVSGLQVVEGTASITNKEVDWYTFSAPSAGVYRFAASKSGTSQLNTVIGIYDSVGNRLGHNNDAGMGLGSASLTTLQLLAGQRVYFGVTNYDSAPTYATRGAYTWYVGMPHSGRTLYLNFGGATITRSTLERYSTGWDYSSRDDVLDADRNGITVQRFLANDATREQVITSIVQLVQADLLPFGITVVRRDGLAAVAGVGATTCYVGAANLTGATEPGLYGVAGSVDRFSDNATDICFALPRWQAEATRTGRTIDPATFMADTILHEAGHTYGLLHVTSTNTSEAMGVVYSGNTYAGMNVKFINRSFTAPDHADYPELPSTQNSYEHLFWNYTLGAGVRETMTSVTRSSAQAMTGTGTSLGALAATSVGPVIRLSSPQRGGSAPFSGSPAAVQVSLTVPTRTDVQQSARMANANASDEVWQGELNWLSRTSTDPFTVGFGF